MKFFINKLKKYYKSLKTNMKNTILEQQTVVEHIITQKQLLSKLEDKIDELLNKYNQTHEVQLTYHDISHEIDMMAGWKK